MDIKIIVAGLPSTRNVFALERSSFINHLLNKMTMVGITALSTTPSIKRMKYKNEILLTTPVAMASMPHANRHQKINFLALLLAAYCVPGI